MKLNQLRNVVIVAERGSLRSAARELGISQPAITRSIQELEHELGATLFERQGTGMVLTAVGRAVLRRAEGIHSDMERLRDEVAQMKGHGTGSISIALSTVAHIALLPLVVMQFRRRYPDVRLNISEGMLPAIEADLHNGTVDFYVGPVWQDESHAQMLVEPLFENKRIIFCRRNHPLAGCSSLRELTGASWITGSLTPVSEDELSPLFERFGLPSPKVAMNGQTFLSMIVATASSDLLTMLPQQWLDVLKSTGLVQEIRVQESLTSATICTVRRAAMPLTPIAEHLSDLFRRAAIIHARTLPGARVLAS